MTASDSAPVPSAASGRRTWLYLLGVAVPNLVIYANHYFGRAGIPWDFSMSYYAMTAFWTALVGDGVFPQWMPFQQMGFPFALQLQSGIDYLPNWFFPAVDQPYTLRAAIVLQCLHVLAGGVGMFALVRRLRRSNAEALIGAVAFQCFGGFFCNAEHVDIVRAFAFSPWLLYLFTFDTELRPETLAAPFTVPRRAWALPLVLWLFLTGGYPGNVFAGGFIIGVYLLLQVIHARAYGASWRWLVSALASLGGLAILGCGMAAVHLGPIALFSGEFVRAQPLASAPRTGMWIEHLPGLFLANGSLPGEVSMTSAYVTLPVVMLVCCASWTEWRRHWVWGGLLMTALVMIADEHVRIGMWIRAAVPVLGLSRFPSSDYRAWIAIPLILFALAGLRTVVSGALSARALGTRLLVCAGWLGAGLWVTARPSEAGVSEPLLAIASAVATGSCLWWLWRRRAGVSTLAMAVTLSLIAADATRVLPAIAGWYEADMDGYYTYIGAPPATRNRGRRLAAELIPANLPASRPARQKPMGLVRWGGYITGRFHANDLTPNVLRRAYRVDASPELQQYMMEAWRPLLFPLNGETSLPEASFSSALSTMTVPADPTGEVAAAVRQVHYGINDIRYEIALAEPALMVENEIYFPGWTAQLDGDANERLEAVEVNGVLRGWRLPTGRHSMTASFALPHLMALRAVSLASAAVWLVALALHRLRRRTP